MLWPRVCCARASPVSAPARGHAAGGAHPAGVADEKLPTVEVRTGHDTHTDSSYDGGVLMRACGWDESAGASNCTGWY